MIASGLLNRVLVQTEITFSISMIESWWRVLKHQWLFLNTLDEFDFRQQPSLNKPLVLELAKGQSSTRRRTSS